MLWNIVDVRDVARAHRLCAETTIGKNGSRYILSAVEVARAAGALKVLITY